MEEQNVYRNILFKIINVIATICTISGISVIGTIHIMLPDIETKIYEFIVESIKNYCIIFLIMFTLFIVLIIVIYIKPNYEISKKDTLKVFAGPSIFSLFLIVGFFSVLLATYFNYYTEAHTKNKSGDEETVDNEVNDAPLDEKKEMIGEYIEKCSEEVVVLEEWRMMNSKDLYYIRNGIFAYSGRFFIEEELTEYYKEFTWYNPSLSSDETWDNINDIQLTNIENIKMVERELNKYK